MGKLDSRLARLEAVRQREDVCQCPFAWDTFRKSFDDVAQRTCDRCGRPFAIQVEYRYLPEPLTL